MPANNFQDIGRALLDAIENGGKDDFKRIMVDVFRQLDQSTGRGVGGAPISGARTSRVPQQLVDYTAGRTQSPLNSQASTRGAGIVEGKQTSFDRDSGYNLETAMVAVGEAVTPNSSVCVLNKVAYLADGTNEARPCHGICVRGTGKDREILWRPGGTAIARVKRSTGVTGYGTLYQSATAGVLTNDPDEAGLTFIQHVGHFKQWVTPAGDTDSMLAEVTIQIAVPGQGGGGISPSLLTTKGDIIARDSTEPVRVGVGANKQMIIADSAEAAGLKWGNPALDDLSDVAISGAVQYQVIQHDGTNWVNAFRLFIDDTTPATSSDGDVWIKLP